MELDILGCSHFLKCKKYNTIYITKKNDLMIDERDVNLASSVKTVLKTIHRIY